MYNNNENDECGLCGKVRIGLAVFGYFLGINVKLLKKNV
jgi:hypothetical protein